MQSLGARAAPRLALQSGPAWNGYIGLRLSVHGRVPPGATGWLALLERVPAGSEGSVVARELVRTVAGPLALQGPREQGAVNHLSALRVPDSARAERLHARGWIESAEGAIVAVADDRCTVARPRRAGPAAPR